MSRASPPDVPVSRVSRLLHSSRSLMNGVFRGASPAEVLRDGGRGTALRPGGGAAAHRPAGGQPADPPAGTCAGRDTVRPFDAFGGAHRGGTAVPAARARGAGGGRPGGGFGVRVPLFRVFGPLGDERGLGRPAGRAAG